MALVLLIAAIIFALVAAYRLDHLVYSSYIQGVRSKTYLDLVEVREAFGKNIQNQSLALRELATFIEENPNVDQETFSRRVRGIRGIDTSTVSVAAAPNMVVSLIDPLEGNEPALGLDYSKNERQFPAILRMIESGTELITGPVNLVQGGTGLILRAPVYLPDTEGLIDEDTTGAGRRFWGIVSLVLDYDQFLMRSGIAEAERKYDLLIVVANRSGEDADFVLYGDRALSSEDAVTLQFNFAFESWVLFAVPKGGWPGSPPFQWQQRIIMAIVGCLLVGALIYVLSLSQARKRARILLRNGIEALNDGFVMFDGDDRLILSNTKYRQIYDLPEEVLKPGTPYVEIFNAWVERQAFFPDESSRSSWFSHRKAMNSAGEKVELEQHLTDGRVIKVSNYPLQDGGSVGLRVDVTELSQAKLAAEAASNAKSDFLSVLSHELRTPLAVILGVARLSKNARLLRSSKTLLAAYEDRHVSSAQAKALLNDVFDQLTGLMHKLEHSGEHLLHLINELLDVAMIESGKLVTESKICNVKDIIDPVALQLSTLALQKGLEFEVVQEAEVVFADKLRARQILINLIGNAIKFTDKGFVRLNVKESNGMVSFEICDSGPGIPEAELQRIFDVFYQVDASQTRRTGGIGMGLAISRNLAMLQGGSLTASSTVGTGSCFVLTLPAH